MSNGMLDETAPLRLILAAENSRKRFKLEGEMLVGRDAACAIVIQSLHISRYHAKILVDEQGASIEDLGSANGTYINGLKLSGRGPLHLGDLVCFDDQAFRVTADAVPEASLGKIRSITAEQLAISPALIAAHQAATQPPPVEQPIITPSPSQPIPSDDQATQPAASFAPIAAGALADEDDWVPPAIAETSGDKTRALTFHEMKEILKQSQALLEADTAEEPRLIVQTPPLEGKVIPLQALEMDTRWKLGSDLTSKICLRDKSIQIDHAYISRNPSGYRLTATSAAKSYILNGQPLRDSYLRHGDLVQLGRITLSFQTDGEKKAVEPSPQAAAVATTQESKSHHWSAIVTAGFILLVVIAAIVLKR